jgi:hypothetical protein
MFKLKYIDQCNLSDMFILKYINEDISENYLRSRAFYIIFLVIDFDRYHRGVYSCFTKNIEVSC